MDATDTFISEVQALMATKEAELAKVERRLTRDRELFDALTQDLAALRQTIDVYRAHHKLPAVETESDHMPDQSLTSHTAPEVVIELARLRGGRLNVSEAAKILVRVGMYQTERNASANIYSAVKRHGERFRKVRPGVYELIEALPTPQGRLDLDPGPQPIPLRPGVDERVLIAQA